MAPLSSDEELLRLMLGGDARAFEALYDRRQGGIYRYALRMTGSKTIAEDVTQEVFLSLIRDRADYQPARGTVQSYLYGMARHRILRLLDRERALVSFENGKERTGKTVDQNIRSNHNPLVELARDEAVDLVRQAVLSLPSHFREVVVLCHFQEMNYADAAEIVGCPIGTVRSRLSRARELLAGKLEALKTSGAGIRKIGVESAI
ncbi:MAG TPA: RNA polymerase sigma factor [Pyrinomonadaceae bacterium]|nr:RNA polymerase sigma factor [Pyrinomonadaceae bacterium]